MLGPPGEPTEILGLDHWWNFEGLTEQYADQALMAPLRSVFTGRPSASVWGRAPGDWSEW